MKEIALMLITITALLGCSALVIEGHPFFGSWFLGIGFAGCLGIIFRDEEE